MPFHLSALDQNMHIIIIGDPPAFLGTRQVEREHRNADLSIVVLR
jgi:hypothetical protein